MTSPDTTPEATPSTSPGTPPARPSRPEGPGAATHAAPGPTPKPTPAPAGQPAGDDTPTGQLPTPRFVALSDRVTSNANTPRPGVGRHAAAGSVSAVDERGALHVDDVVVEKVAVAAAGEIDGVGGAARRVLGVPTGRDHGEQATDRRPRVSAKVTGQTAALEVRLTVAYPASVRAVTEAVRAHVRHRVTALTELRVTRVDITVAALTHTTTPTRRVIA